MRIYSLYKITYTLDQHVKWGISIAKYQGRGDLGLLWLHPNYKSPKKNHRGLK